MNHIIQTLISSTMILGTIVIVYFSIRSFIRSVTGKGSGCHGLSDSECTHCRIEIVNNKSIKTRNKKNENS